MEFTKMTDADWKYPLPRAPKIEGFLPVPDTQHPEHQLHYEIHGNLQGEPVMFLHGGPGGGCDRDYARFFDPKRYCVILFDQRGCGKSTPHVKEDRVAAMKNNITHELVADVERLRTHLGFKQGDKMHLFGGSWGSTLALAYAQTHPKHVEDLILRGIFLCNKQDLSFFYQGNARDYDDSKPPQAQDTSIPGAYRAYLSDGEYTIPEAQRDPRMAKAYADAWDNFVKQVPKAERGDMIGAYHHLLNDPSVSKAKRQAAAVAWSYWEGVTSYLNQDVDSPKAIERFKNPRFAIAFATIENEYFYRSLNGGDPTLSGLMREENLRKIAHIPTYIRDGKHDQVCCPQSGYDLRDGLTAAGMNKLDFAETPNAGHSMSEKTTNAALTGIMENLPPMKEVPSLPLEAMAREHARGNPSRGTP